jgi:hypothetical protein
VYILLSSQLVCLCWMERERNAFCLKCIAASTHLQASRRLSIPRTVYLNSSALRYGSWVKEIERSRSACSTPDLNSRGRIRNWVLKQLCHMRGCEAYIHSNKNLRNFSSILHIIEKCFKYNCIAPLSPVAWLGPGREQQRCCENYFVLMCDGNGC